MSDKKILAIDPEMFTFSNNTTRKKQDKPHTESKIKMKASAKPAHNTSLKKRSIINMMRKHQEEQYKQKFDDPSKKRSTDQLVSGFHSDFDNATSYFKNLQENIAKTTHTPKNHTLKNQPSLTSVSPITIHSPALHELQDVSSTINTSLTSPTTRINTQIMPPPLYGCLKNGTLPTYRSLMNQTRKHTHEPLIGGTPSTNTNSNINTIQAPVQNVVNNNSTSVVKPAMTDLTKSAIQSNQIQTKLENMKLNQIKPKKMKRKKTIRRTYKIGRSKIMPKVSVLVSNKTIRNRISTKSHLIKQTPLHEIRKYLVKHGFIRVGAITPNDVLRKMYETAMLMCGEIHNHNPDNLLYNFLHETDS